MFLKYACNFWGGSNKMSSCALCERIELQRHHSPETANSGQCIPNPRVPQTAQTVGEI